MEYKLKILKKKRLTHDVVQFTLEKPEGYSFTAGQAVEATIDDPKFKDEWRPFTITSLNSDDTLEFTIKIYPGHNGMTLALSKLHERDNVIITDPWDSFKNKGAGVFIAGGTGVTPFIALLRQMEKENDVKDSKLIFSNKKEEDIFLEEEFRNILGPNFINLLTKENKAPYLHGRINKDFLKMHISDFDQPFYLCGPEGFAEDIKGYLKELGAKDNLVNVSL